MPPLPSAQTRMYFSDGDHLDVLETIQDMTDQQWPAPKLGGLMLLLTLPNGKLVWVNLRQVTRVEQLV